MNTIANNGSAKEEIAAITTESKMQDPHGGNNARHQNHPAYPGLHRVWLRTRRAPRAEYLRRTTPVVIALTVWLPLAAKAAFTYIGFGAASCGEWSSGRDAEGPTTPAGNWVLGFISGFAAANEERHFDPLASTDADRVWAWMDHYCMYHPTDKIIDAALTFLEFQRSGTASPVISPNERAPPHRE